MRQREFRNSSRHSAHVSAAAMKVGKALNTATCPAEEWRGSRRGQEVASGGVENWKWGEQENVPLVSHHWAFATLRHTIHPASTNKHGMLYKKESHSPDHVGKGCGTLLLMQTPGLRFLADVIQSSPWGEWCGHPTPRQSHLEENVTAHLTGGGCYGF